MSTGIPSKNTNHAEESKITIEYEGKKASEDILSSNNDSYSPVRCFNDKSNKIENQLFYGDNFDVLLFLLNTGFKERINLIYIDPPYSTESFFVNRDQEHAYSDSLSGGSYVEFLRERLIIMRELLSRDGSIYLHLDGNMAFTMKLIMDEVFGSNNFRSFITRKKCSTKNYTKNTYGNISDYILFYSKSSDYSWIRPYAEWDSKKIKEQYPYVDSKTGRRYKKVPIHAPGTRNGETGKAWNGMMPPKGKHWQYTPEKLTELDKAGEIYWSPTGNPRRIVYFEPEKGIPVQDIWLDYRDSINQAQKTTGYPTEKNYEMLKMIISASSKPGDIVLDCFAGSGTTLGAAYELDRKWIGVDNSIESIKAIIKRFTVGLDTYGDYVSKKKTDGQLLLDLDEKCSFNLLCKEEEKNDLSFVIEEPTKQT